MHSVQHRITHTAHKDKTTERGPKSIQKTSPVTHFDICLMYYSRKKLVVFMNLFACPICRGNKQTAVCTSELPVTQEQASASQTQIANHANVSS